MKVLFVVQTAIIAALYAALTYAQNFLLPGTTSAAVQFRVSEALNVLALFTPAAIPGLTLGCVLSNIYNIGSGLPLDMIFGSLATLGATTAMYLLRNVNRKLSAFISSYACCFQRNCYRLGDWSVLHWGQIPFCKLFNTGRFSRFGWAWSYACSRNNSLLRNSRQKIR